MECDKINYKKIIEKISEAEKFKPKCCCFGIVGPQGKEGLAGTNANDACCFCVEQMVNVFEQLITLYPNDTVTINMDSGINASGRLSALVSAPSLGPGVLQLKNASGEITNELSICQMTSITIEGATYNNTITYLPFSTPLPTGCCMNCQEAFRNLLPVSDKEVRLRTGSQTVATGKVIKNEPVMVVVAGNDN